MMLAVLRRPRPEWCAKDKEKYYPCLTVDGLVIEGCRYITGVDYFDDSALMGHNDYFDYYAWQIDAYTIDGDMVTLEIFRKAKRATRCITQ